MKQLAFKEIEDCTIDDFVNGLHDGNSLERLRRYIYFIHEQRYQDAIDTIGEESGNFINGGIDINDEIRNYCKEQLCRYGKGG